ncbi:MAG: ribonuclease Y [Candidatus Cloacimonetes bacterium]|jgi:ribonuclease Y|nr:ribonuclease Y [Candidatus Cloacimonadota bacterium]MDY0337213.1 ribonuclease Y [Candidatus Cloacimonadaceae bacterium]MCB5268795.1 ribonuclease Y [Candidatus Cloacimonadota bacterium]MCK9333891.1 ribonuclease Y [Candidatus Cloacimonadota bacterium]MDD2682556.1 ribonuclease Y [Candidatus Cloacimonadota bacterium]
MNNPYILGVLGLVLGFVIALVIYFIRRNSSFKLISQANEIADNIKRDAKTEAETSKKEALLEAREEWFKQKRILDEEVKERQRELRSQEKKYNERLGSLDKRLDSLDKKENSLSEQERKLKSKEDELQEKTKEYEHILSEQKNKLAEVAGLTREEALERLRTELINTARQVAANDAKISIEQIKLDTSKKVSEILSTAIQRMAVDHVSETTVSVVSLPSDEMKGRIIGREGRNIRTFEKASGVDLIIDDTPEAVVLSCFDPVRREIARLSLEKLISDGRIHPGRIEEVIAKTTKEMEENLIKIGEKAVLETNIHNISPNLIKVLGRLHYRTSYGQNVLQHSIEAAWICGILAAEINLDQEVARRAGLLHDIGKAVDHEFDGTHAIIGANLARKNGEGKIIVNAIEAHHEEVEATSVYAALVQASDAISGARPGARREMLETYMQRLAKLEEIANNVDGVNKSYAIQAGRELRIIVEPSMIEENQTPLLATEIAASIEKQVQYPGQIKVTVIRETRQIAMAK